jgi:fermentation-respiration switch protein FrsA (DUF1100 family)
MKQSNAIAKSFISGGIKCAADLYLPAKSTGKIPCIVMAHGFTATKDLGIHVYAKSFVEAGIAVLAFDYRNWGESEGEPHQRQVGDAKKQREDFHAAISYARSLDGIDPARIAIWGSSFSGGHVIAVAGEDPKIAAVISQVPMIDMVEGRGVGVRLPVGMQIRLLIAVVIDALYGKLGLDPYLVPAAGNPGDFALWTDPEAKPFFDRMIAEGSKWRNEWAPRFALAPSRYKEGTAEGLKMPLMILVADKDVYASPEYAVQIAKKAPQGEVRRYPCGHFAFYLDEMREKSIADEVEFLRKHLLK